MWQKKFIAAKTPWPARPYPQYQQQAAYAEAEGYEEPAAELSEK